MRSSNEIVEYYSSEGERIRKAPFQLGTMGVGMIVALFLPVVWVGLIVKYPPERPDLFWRLIKGHPVITGLILMIPCFVFGREVAQVINKAFRARAERRATELEWKASVLKNLHEINSYPAAERQILHPLMRPWKE